MKKILEKLQKIENLAYRIQDTPIENRGTDKDTHGTDLEKVSREIIEKIIEIREIIEKPYHLMIVEVSGILEEFKITQDSDEADQVEQKLRDKYGIPAPRFGEDQFDDDMWIYHYIIGGVSDEK